MSSSILGRPSSLLAIAVVLLGVGLMWLDPGVSLLGLGLAVLGLLLLLGQFLSATPGAPGPDQREAEIIRRRAVVAIVAGLLVVTGLFLITSSSAPNCGPVSELGLRPATFPSSTSPNASLAQVSVENAPCPNPTTVQIHVLLDLHGLVNVSALCGPGYPSDAACPAPTQGWYVLLVDPSGAVQDAYPTEAGGDGWINGGVPVAPGDAFVVVASEPLEPTGATFGLQIDWTGCDVPWCGTALVTL
jgi:hypothetical protein